MLCLVLCKLKARSSGLFLFIIFHFCIGLFEIESQEFFINLDDSIHSPVWLNLHTINSGYAHSGSYYSLADSAEQYGLGIESEFPETLKGINTWLKVEGWVKSNRIADNASFVTSLFSDNEQLYWQNIYFSDLLKETETWYYFADSVKVPASITRDGKFKAYLWNNDLKDAIAIDDLKISFDELQNPSFIPFQNEKSIKSDTKDQLLFSNQYYSMFFNNQSKILSIRDSYGIEIIKKLSIFDIVYFLPHKRKSKSYNSQLRLKSIKQKAGNTIISLVNKDECARTTIYLLCKQGTSEIRFDIVKKYNTSQSVTSESIVFESNQKVDEVYRSNRKSDISGFQTEYWLDKQGVKFGNKENSWVIYHQPEISSLQLDTEKNQLWVNLDFVKDHPFLHFPLIDDTVDYKIDWSDSQYKRGDKRAYTFSIFVGSNTSSLARFMKNPEGYLATYIWTEHADFTNLSTNRATYFGSEKITVADSSIGGFIKYGIPVTKSVFYANPDQVTNTNVSNGKFPELEASLKEDKLYLDFLKQLQENGSEICLHTPENFTTNSQELEEALQFMRKEFNSPSWIDHGYNNGFLNNRENLVCDGTIKRSDYYALGLWKQYGVRYFWNPYYEDYFTYKNWKFGALIGKPNRGFGDFMPDPDYWQHPTRTGELIHWPTKSVLFVPDDELWEYNFSDKVLNEFVNSWGVEINHCYPAWVDPAKGFWVYDADSTIVAALGLNRTLERMATLRDKGKLNVTTIAEFIDYQLAIDQVNYEILPDGRIKITNSSNRDIGGISFATKARYVLIDDQVPEQKMVDKDIVFWFDLPKNESKLIRTID